MIRYGSLGKRRCFHHETFNSSLHPQRWSSRRVTLPNSPGTSSSTAPSAIRTHAVPTVGPCVSFSAGANTAVWHCDRSHRPTWANTSTDFPTRQARRRSTWRPFGGCSICWLLRSAFITKNDETVSRHGLFIRSPPGSYFSIPSMQRRNQTIPGWPIA